MFLCPAKILFQITDNINCGGISQVSCCKSYSKTGKYRVNLVLFSVQHLMNEFSHHSSFAAPWEILAVVARQMWKCHVKSNLSSSVFQRACLSMLHSAHSDSQYLFQGHVNIIVKNVLEEQRTGASSQQMGVGVALHHLSAAQGRASAMLQSMLGCQAFSSTH